MQKTILFDFDIEKEIRRYSDIVCAAEEELRDLKEIKARFPDAKCYVNEGSIAFFSNMVYNKEADGIEIKYACTCCHDASVMATPFVTVGGKKIYSTQEFKIGEKFYYKDLELPGWKEILCRAGISEELIGFAEAYFETKRIIYKQGP